VTHQDALQSILSDPAAADEAQEQVRAAGDFFLESLSSFEMVQRGFKEARQALVLQRRHTELSRQLSSFLGDASLALNATDSVEEMLRLVSEQARELLGAECCMTTVAIAGYPRAAEAASYPEDDARWTRLLRWLDLHAIYGLVRSSGGSLRMAREQLRRLPAFRTVGGDGPPNGWLAASLTTLDGRELGAIQVFDKQHGAFTAEDAAVLVHLAQTASAAIERTTLYGDPN